MRFAVSRVWALIMFAAYGWLLYTSFKARAPVILVSSMFVGAFLIRAGTYPLFDWGEGHRPWGGRCWYALTMGGILLVAALSAAALLPPAIR